MVTDKDVSYVADLAHLELTEEERPRMLKDLNSILGYIDSLNELDTTNVEPMAQVAERTGRGGIRVRHAGRRTAAFACRTRKRCATRPQSDGVFFKVPKVIER